MIPYGKQTIEQIDVDTVISALQSDYLTQGPKIKEFEEKFAEYVGSKYAVAVSNGTAALHLCTLALGVKEGDKVITTPITFAASANCIRYCGGEVVFSDINPSTLLLDIEKVRILLENSPKGSYKGIIPVDFGGRVVDLQPFRKLADEFNLWIIEDACHAPGGYSVDESNNKIASGSCKYSELAIFSFHPVKHFTSGEGGMITTNHFDLYQNLLKLRSHGITKNEDEFSNSIEFACGQTSTSNNYPAWYMEMQTLGFNYRLTDFQAALGLSQLERANIWIQRRREIALYYSNSFKDLPFIRGQSGTIEGHAYHLYIIEVEDRLGLYNYLRENGILAQIHYIPCHLMPYYKQFGWKEGDMPISENYYKHCISLPIFPSLTNDEQTFIINCVKKYYGK
ncbi:UDP-4-amino-4,6-dideoxy-N-acetyl-beta-L-altrosamine transaminase [Sediminibacterium sp. C3]|uniref:UDP-4-amino-4, 6-dideoxy-N-acetyl-beta-L-altrosamine transaminase n=1 Tax=Sediminibacterium sp. C3 TaxID=1267211 RepID=UPI00040E33CE|nr:UDP-4-amino-4,6-dideoxy-N-acetyl-beta-L-altrosamine transaminase [Sediminibacterium sp. C3]